MTPTEQATSMRGAPEHDSRRDAQKDRARRSLSKHVTRTKLQLVKAGVPTDVTSELLLAGEIVHIGVASNREVFGLGGDAA